MTALLCLLFTLFIGLHFGGRFAQAHMGGHSLIPPVLAQALVAALLVHISLLLPHKSELLALGVALSTLLSFALGTLLHAGLPGGLRLRASLAQEVSEQAPAQAPVRTSLAGD